MLTEKMIEAAFSHPQFEARMRDAISFTVRETLGFVNGEIVNELFTNINTVISHCASPPPAGSVKALEVMSQALIEYQHAMARGPSWYTNGEAGMKRHLRAWDDRVKAALSAQAQDVAGIVPAHCTGTRLAIEGGCLHVRKDGSGYIVIDESDFKLEDDRGEGPDGPEGSVHWIANFPAGEMTALRDFLNGQGFAAPSAVIPPRSDNP